MFRVHKSLRSSLLWRRNLVNLPSLREANKLDISQISEVKQREIFLKSLEDAATSPPSLNNTSIQRFHNSGMTISQLQQVVDAGMMTFLLHVESRIASSLGQGFYTIGPCGEESLSAIGLNFKESDASALHYRHVSLSILRQLRQGRTTAEIILDRARGFTCSTLDPVTGGKHCAIGGTPYDYIVTSTLASQACPAVGRALSIPLSNALRNATEQKGGSGASSIPIKFPKDSISIVSVGEGSTNNAHFLSALNLAEYSAYMKRKCPILFIVSDNGICISLLDNGWVTVGPTSRVAMKRWIVDGSDVVDLYSKSREATEYCRRLGRPAVLVIRGLVRRFGHAATDRQAAYLTAEQIATAASTNHLADTIELASNVGVFGGSRGILDRFCQLKDEVENAFNLAVNEEKISSRHALCQGNAPPLAPVATGTNNYQGLGSKVISPSSATRYESMRKHMTTFFDEALSGQTVAGDRVVYLGEDVRHGGYYLVTEGLYGKYPTRIHDFPPDETALLGVAQGISQSGLVPIVEIPYAKYLDCGYDMFLEIGLTYWLSNGSQKDGLIMRIQGFDRGKFGGNFHTHNMITVPPGVDVVCYSNGGDYVRGMRYNLRQAATAGRIVMSYDSTDLLNRRHLGDDDSGAGRDDLWLTAYPPMSLSEGAGGGTEGRAAQGEESELAYDDVILYRGDWVREKIGSLHVTPLTVTSALSTLSPPSPALKLKLLMVTYGNGLPNCLLAMKRLISSGLLSPQEVAVIDSPYLSSPPEALKKLLASFSGASASAGPAVIFADVCKEGSGMIFSGFAVNLQNEGILPSSWRVIGSQPTYNPLGSVVTFLSSEDVEKAAKTLLRTSSS